ncbi:MAG TPA: orotate phosphoribosyltransferase [Gemmatimonadaceae bacterium]|nr:orotate phosphoribosyltransferase [Gemmatimonadaceae bacterium]
MTERQRLIHLLATRSVKTGYFKLASGRTSDLYIDARLTTMSPEGLSLIGPLAIQMLKAAEWELDSIGGLTLGADPIAYSISYASNFTPPLLRAFTIRKEAKTHGTRRLIEGTFLDGDRVVVVEDVITTGYSALKAVDAIKTAGGHIAGVFTLVDRQEGGREAIEDAGYRVISVTHRGELMSLISHLNEHPNSAVS